MNKLFKAILKTIFQLVLCGAIVFVIDLITDLLPWTIPVLLITIIILLIVIYYFEDKEG